MPVLVCTSVLFFFSRCLGSGLRACLTSLHFLPDAVTVLFKVNVKFKMLTMNCLMGEGCITFLCLLWGHIWLCLGDRMGCWGLKGKHLPSCAIAPV